MKVDTLKDIVKSVESETAMSVAMLKFIQSGKLDGQDNNSFKHRKGYVPDSMEKVVTWLEETYDELKVFVPFRYWNSPVLDKAWLNERRDEIEIRFATGGVFIRLDDMKRYLDHSIKERYDEELLKSYADRYDNLAEDEAVSLGFGTLTEDDPYVKAFKDRNIKVTRSGLYAVRRPIELVDSGTGIVMSKLLKMKRFDFDSVKSEIKSQSLLNEVEDGYVEDKTSAVYKIDKKFNYVPVRLIGDTYGEQVKIKRIVYTQQEKDRMVQEFLNKRNNNVR